MSIGSPGTNTSISGTGSTPSPTPVSSNSSAVGGPSFADVLNNATTSLTTPSTSTPASTSPETTTTPNTHNLANLISSLQTSGTLSSDDAKKLTAVFTKLGGQASLTNTATLSAAEKQALEKNIGTHKGHKGSGTHLKKILDELTPDDALSEEDLASIKSIVAKLESQTPPSSAAQFLLGKLCHALEAHQAGAGISATTNAATPGSALNSAGLSQPAVTDSVSQVQSAQAALAQTTLGFGQADPTADPADNTTATDSGTTDDTGDVQDFALSTAPSDTGVLNENPTV